MFKNIFYFFIGIVAIISLPFSCRHHPDELTNVISGDYSEELTTDSQYVVIVNTNLSATKAFKKMCKKNTIRTHERGYDNTYKLCFISNAFLDNSTQSYIIKDIPYNYSFINKIVIKDNECIIFPENSYGIDYSLEQIQGLYPSKSVKVSNMVGTIFLLIISIGIFLILIWLTTGETVFSPEKIKQSRIERKKEEEERERKKIEGFKNFIKESKQHFSFNHLGVAVYNKMAYFPHMKGLTENSWYVVAEGKYDSYDNVCYIYVDGSETFKIYNKGEFSPLHKAIKLGKVNGLLELRLGGNFQLRIGNFDNIEYCTIIFHCTLPKVEKVKQIYTTNNSITKEERAKQLCNSYNATDRDKGMDVSENVDVPYILRHVFGSTCKCMYCGETNWRLLGCDRINNNRPHSQDNIVVSCRNCNIERSNKYSVTEFKRIKQKEMHELGLN